MEPQECLQPAVVASVVDGFGVSVELSAVFEDDRARCWVWVEPRRPARWLLARLLAALHPPAPPRPLALLAPRGLLLPDDPLALLQPNDTVRVVPVNFDLFETVETHNEQAEKQLASRHISEQMEVTVPHSAPAVPALFPASPPRSPAPPPRSHASPPRSPALQEMKQRALQLLEQYVDTPRSPPPHSAAESPPARARRRRVRRRRRPADTDGADETDGPPPAKVPTVDARCESPVPVQAARASPDTAAPAPTEAQSPAAAPERAACGRGGCGLRGGPPPRLVRAL